MGGNEFVKCPDCGECMSDFDWQTHTCSSEKPVTSDNRDYTKCALEVLQYLKYSKDSKAGRDIVEIIRKHFA